MLDGRPIAPQGVFCEYRALDNPKRTERTKIGVRKMLCSDCCIKDGRFMKSKAHSDEKRW
jgi:hypothetical protein